MIQRDLIRLLGRTREGLQEGDAQGNSKLSRTGLAEILNASSAHGIMGWKIHTEEKQRLSLSSLRIPG